jgi:3'-5' exoribonuclease
MKLSTISSFKAGSTIHGFYICKQKSHRNTKNGDVYLDLILQDKTGRISAKIWDDVSHFDDLFESSEPVAVKGKVENYNSRNQLIIKQIKRADLQTYEKYGFSLFELIEKVDDSIDDLWNVLSNAVKSLKSPYKKLVKSVVKEFDTEIKSIPATINYHYPISGGFLKYITTMITTADFLLKSYKYLNRDLIISGIILHDIGKVKALRFSTEGEYTDVGKLIGHNSLSLEILNEFVEDINIKEEILLKLKHIILSHQYNSQNATYMEPQFSEALFINLLSNLNVNMDLMHREMKNDHNEDWTDPDNYFNRQLWKK